MSDSKILENPNQLVLVECISELQPWATVRDSDGVATLRPMREGERCVIPAHEAVRLAKRNPVANVRHVTIIGPYKPGQKDEG